MIRQKAKLPCDFRGLRRRFTTVYTSDLVDMVYHTLPNRLKLPTKRSNLGPKSSPQTTGKNQSLALRAVSLPWEDHTFGLIVGGPRARCASENMLSSISMSRQSFVLAPRISHGPSIEGIVPSAYRA